MDINNLLASDLSDTKKVQLLLEDALPKKIKTYQDYYDGEHEVLKRYNKADPSVEVNKIVLNFCKQIVDFATYWLLANPPKLINNTPELETTFLDFEKSYKDALVNNLNIKLGQTLFSETRAAELLTLSEGKVKYLLLSLRDQTFNANFDDKGNLTAFVRKYIVNEQIESKVKKIHYIELYTKGGFNKWRETDEDKNEYEELSTPEVKKLKENYKKINKIPVVYYEIKEPLFWPVKSLQDRLNEIISRLADTNDYFADPILKLFGDIVRDKDGKIGLRKATTGKVMHLQSIEAEGAQIKSDAEYLTWDNMPESIKFEVENLIQNVLYLTHTANISFDNLKGNIGNLSGSAIKLMFLDSTLFTKSLKAVLHDFQRRVNVHKALLDSISATTAYAELDISVEFQNPIPTNEKEFIDMLSVSVMSGFMSKETAIEKNPLISNSEAEKKRIESEKEVNNFGESFNL